MGVTINTHFCSGEKISESLYASAKKCDHDDRKMKACCAFKDHYMKVKKHDKNCCNDHSTYVWVKKENIQTNFIYKDVKWVVTFFNISFPLVEDLLRGTVDSFKPTYKYPPPCTRDPVSELCVQLC
ncbi:MAG: hypothetical protein J5I59_02140 [Saprospiraceae bacterium]|nr:hypothetical protein [Saprospiraceae bacterium]